MKNTNECWVVKAAGLLLALGIITGCATQQAKFISPEVAARVHKIAVYEEISTPTSLTTPFRAGGGGLLGAAVGAAIQAKNQKAFTSEVSAKLDFQEFAALTTRDLMHDAIVQHAGWTLVPTNETEKADAMFVVDVELMGVDDPPAKFIPTKANMGYRPVVTIRATLIANPPFEIVRGKTGPRSADPVANPVLFEQVGRATNKDALKGYSSNALTGSAEAFKSAFRESFNVAIKKLSDGWTPKTASK